MFSHTSLKILNVLFYTFHISCTLLLPPLYTTLSQVDISHLGYPLHNIPALSIVRRVPGFSFTFLAVLLIAWPYTLPLYLSLLFLTFSLSPALFPLQDALASFPFVPSFITNTPCICAPFLHTYNTAPSIPLALPLAFLNSTPHLITLLAKISNLFWEVSFPFFSSSFLQYWAQCLNLLHFQHTLSHFSSNFALSEARACFSLSRLLIIS